MAVGTKEKKIKVKSNDWTPQRWAKEFRTAIPWNKEQLAVFDAAENTDDHLMIEAVAGAGKSTVLKALIGLFPNDTKINVLMFNVSVKDAFAEDPRVPKRVNVSTAHGYCQGMLIGKFEGEMPKLEEGKSTRLANYGLKKLKDAIRQIESRKDKKILPESREASELILERWRDELKKLIDFARLNLVVPGEESLDFICGYFAIRFPFGKWGKSFAINQATELLEVCFREALYEKTIDYTDMLWMVYRLGLKPRPPAAKNAVLLIDECVTGDTLVTLADGSQLPIKEIVNQKLEVEVVSFNTTTQQLEVKQITGWHEVPLRGRGLVKVGKLKATTDHPVYTQESGYIYARDLNSNHSVLEINGEKLQSIRPFNRDRKVNYSGFSSWRRINKHQSLEGKTGERTGDVHTWNSSARISFVETGTTQTLGWESRTQQCYPYRIRRSYPTFQHTKPSSIYGNILDDASGCWKEKTYTGSPVPPQSPSPSSLVHGRWKLYDKLPDINLCVPRRRHSESSRLSEQLGSHLQATVLQKGNSIGFYCGRSKKFVPSNRFSCSSFNVVQNNSWSDTTRQEAETECNQNREVLPSLWKSSPDLSVSQYRSSFTSILQPNLSEFCTKNSEPNVDLSMFNLWTKLPEQTQTIDWTSLQSNMQQKMQWQIIESTSDIEEERVYCIDVADNHNFFADSILTHNCQDASPAMLSLYNKFKEAGYRLIGVGDRYQAITGAFAGARNDAMDKFAEMTDATCLPLAETQRCPKSHAALASLIVSDIRARQDAKVGSSKLMHPDTVRSVVTPGDLVICRFVSPLIKLFLQAKFFEGKEGIVRSRNIAAEMGHFATTISGRYGKWSEFADRLAEQKEYQVGKLREGQQLTQADAVDDRFQCLEYCYQYLGKGTKSLDDFIERLKDAFPVETEDRSKHVIYSSIHSAKGDESSRVIIVGANILPYQRPGMLKWMFAQEVNATYVAITRSKDELIFVPLDRTEEGVEILLQSPLAGMQMEYFPNINSMEDF